MMADMRMEGEPACPACAGSERIRLYPCVELTFFSLQADRYAVRHAPLDHVMEINYCRVGRMGWRMCNGNTVYLGPRDFALHTMKCCANAEMTLPTGRCEGMTLRIDLRALSDDPPAPLADTPVTGEMLYDRFCRDGALAFFAGNEQTEAIFSAFYDQPQALRLACRRLKAMELLLYLAGAEADARERLTGYQADQIEVIREVHEHLIRHMDQRVTIEALSRQYLMNPTTLKAAFKAVYGTSIAAHIKEHRMERAAQLLLETDLSVAQIAQQVGYESQSKFTSAFKECTQMLPREYRKKR